MGAKKKGKKDFAFFGVGHDSDGSTAQAKKHKHLKYMCFENKKEDGNPGAEEGGELLRAVDRGKSEDKYCAVASKRTFIMPG